MYCNSYKFQISNNFVPKVKKMFEVLAKSILFFLTISTFIILVDNIRKLLIF